MQKHKTFVPATPESKPPKFVVEVFVEAPVRDLQTGHFYPGIQLYQFGVDTLYDAQKKADSCLSQGVKIHHPNPACPMIRYASSAVKQVGIVDVAAMQRIQAEEMEKAKAASTEAKALAADAAEQFEEFTTSVVREREEAGRSFDPENLNDSNGRQTEEGGETVAA